MKVIRNRCVNPTVFTSAFITLSFLFVSGTWIFGAVICKMFVSVGYFSLCAGVLTVMAMSIDRFQVRYTFAEICPIMFHTYVQYLCAFSLEQSVVFAVKTRTIRTSRRAKRIICVIWFFAFLYMTPAAVFAGAWKAYVIKRKQFIMARWFNCLFMFF